MTNFQRFPSPNPKYPFVGPNYQQYGEVAGYVYYPWKDQYYVDPKSQQQYAEANGLAQKQPSKPGLGEQMLPVAGVLTTGYIATEVGKGVGGKISNAMFGDTPAPQANAGATPTTAATTPTSNGMLSAQGPAATAPQGGAPTGVPADATPLAKPNLVGVQRTEIVPVGPAENGVQPMSDGSKVMADGTVQTPDGATVTANGEVTGGTGVNVAQAMQYASYVLAAYNAYRAMTDKDATKTDKAIGVTQAGISAGQAYTGGNPYLSAASGALNVYGTYNNDNMTSEQQATRAQQQVGLAVADFYTYGLASMAEGALRRNKTTGGMLAKLDKLDQRTNPVTIALSKFGSSKGAEQMARDRVRKHLEERGVINQGDQKDWMLRFSDGSSFDIGKDGGARLTNAAGQERQYSDVDFSDPRAGQVVGAVQPLAAVLTGGNERLGSDFSGLYTNAVLNGSPDDAAASARIRELYAKHNVTAQDVLNGINELEKDKKIDAQRAAAYRNGVTQVFSTGNLQLTPAPASGGMLNKGPLQSGATPQQNVAAVSGNNVGANVGSLAQQQPYQIPQGSGGMLRSRTSSPGIDKNGRRISYGNA